jgi:hypothetical protein
LDVAADGTPRTDRPNDRDRFPPGPEDSTRLSSKLLVVAFVAALGHFWVRRHLGIGGDTPWVAAVIAGLGVVDTVIGKLLSKSAKEAFDAKVRTALAQWLTGSLAMLICAALLVAALLLSSVTVVPGEDAADGRSQLTVRLVSLDGEPVAEATSGPDKAPARLTWLRTSPFGRGYRLTVDGYLEEPITVYPLIGSTIAPQRDLRRSPSVLFRPPIPAVQALASGGTFVVSWRRSGTAPARLFPPQKDHDGSFLVGRGQPMPPAMSGNWRLELSDANVVNPALSQMLRRWNHIRVIQPTVPLTPAMILVAEVRSRRVDLDDVIARAEVTLGTEQLIDVPLLARGD